MVVKEGSLITIDTNCLIYYFEVYPEYAELLEKLFTDIQDGRIGANISILSLLEILVKPKKQNDIFLQNRYKLLLFNYPNLSIKEIDLRVIDMAATLRAKYNVKTPDSIIIATAIVSDSQYLLSNDIKLKSICEGEGIIMLQISDLGV